MEGGREGGREREEAITSRAEEEHARPVKVAVQFISDGHLSMGKRREHFIIRRTHVWVYVVKQDCKRVTAQCRHLDGREGDSRWRRDHNMAKPVIPGLAFSSVAPSPCWMRT